MGEAFQDMDSNHCHPWEAPTSSQHLLVQQLEGRELQDAGGDVGPEPDGAERGHPVGVSQGGDVQAGHLVLHLCAAGRKEGGQVSAWIPNPSIPRGSGCGLT